MTGLEMLPKVKEMRPEVPVIMITAYGDTDTKCKALASGDRLLAKPIDFSLLRDEIDERLAAAGQADLVASGPQARQGAAKRVIDPREIAAAFRAWCNRLGCQITS